MYSKVSQPYFAPRMERNRQFRAPATPAPPGQRKTGAILPSEPSSGNDRRRMIHATLFRLSIALGVRCKTLAAMPYAELTTVVDRVPRGHGNQNRHGRSHRLAEKLLRLQGK